MQKLLPLAIDKSIIQHEVRQYNIHRIAYLVIFGVPLHALFAFLFYIKPTSGTLPESQWRMYIITIHLVVTAVYLLLGGINFYIKKSRRYRGFFPSFVIYFVPLFVPIAGAALATADQLITNSISPFLLTCLIAPLTLLIPPAYSAISFSISFLSFYILIALTQHNQDVLLSNRINGLAAAAVSFALSIILWRTNLIRFRQARLIISQNQALEANYNQLLQSSEELSRVNATKDKFFSILAHDLRGPITSTLSISELLLQNQVVQSDEARNQVLQMVFSSLTNTSKLLENLLLWSRNQTETISYQPETLNLHSLIRENMALYVPIAIEKGIELNNQVADPIHVLADKEMLNIVVRNLISNAIKFTFSGGAVQVHAQLLPQEKGSASYVQIEVRDSGVGVDALYADKLFQIDKKTSTLGTNQETGTGTGLGLILCKEFVERNGGKIWLESEPNKGSSFIFTIPYSPALL